MYATGWNWIVAANILLGINQGLTWSSTVMMKIDLVGEKQRGVAMGLNEFAGYIAVAVVAFLTGWIAGKYGLRPYPFYLGAVIAFFGFFSSWLLIRDTKHHVAHEAVSSNISKLKNIFWETTWRNKNLSSVTQAGLINNLNDGMVWGILPILLASKNFTIKEIGIVTAVYPAVWGAGQIIAGRMADKFCKRDMLFLGMILQAIALFLFVAAVSFTQFILLAILLGWATAMVYPTFLAAIAENTHPVDRAKSLGVFRLWRDMGYAIGAIITGIIADLIGINASIIFIGALTFISGLIVFYRMKCGARVVKLADWFIGKISGKKNSYTL
jgi:MFS family permease